MKFPMYSYRDNKVGFGSPFCDQNDNTAMRGFSFAVSNPDGLLNFAKADYDCFRVGYFDTEKGILVPEEVPVLIMSGSSVGV